MKKNVLVLAPHPDDMELGLGATLARHQDDWDVTLVICCSLKDYRNEASPEISSGLWLEQRRNDTFAAAATLGVKNVKNVLMFSENLIDGVDISQVVRQIENSIIVNKPDLLFTCLPSINQDHKLLYDCTLTAVRHMGKFPHLRGVVAYEYPDSFMTDMPTFGWEHSVVSQEHLNKKTNALWMHSTQREGFEGYDEIVEALAKLRGYECGVALAERFLVLRSIT